jgi:hypothetical protein
MEVKRVLDMRYKLLLFICCGYLSLTCQANDNAELNQNTAGPCEYESQRSVSFVSADSKDVLRVKVAGTPCSEAILTIKIENAQTEVIYEYENDFITHMPFLIYEPELNGLVEYFVDKVLQGAITRTTQSLPEYSNVDDYYELTNDFVIVPIAEYDDWRDRHQPILWHVTGDSSWVHWIFDEKENNSKLLLRGGVFSN